MNAPAPTLHAAASAAAPGSAPAPHGWPLLRLGFRPFYLGAALFAAFALPLWIALFTGRLSLQLTLPALLWHAHEMLFGFAVAVIVGFLLTAGKAWTGLATPRGPWLGALALLWAAARIAAFGAPYAVYAALDLLLLPLVAAVLGERLLRARSWRNLPLALILLLLCAANAAFHLAVLGVVEWSALAALRAGLALIVMIECVIAGRVIPAFTVSATPGLKLRAWPALERATLATTALALALWVLAPSGGLGGGLGAALGGTALAAAALLHVLRQWRWHPWATRTRPILWILHAAYAWIAIGCALLALALLLPSAGITESAGLHALAVGATGGLIIGMITRTARGHTGRPLRASRAEVLAYSLVLAAAVLRVVLPLAAPQWLPHALLCAAAAWSLAFLIYLGVFGRWLLSTRLDGKDG